MEDTAFHLAIHYIQDLFHYDGKLWHTFKSLVTRPGLVACEYMEGKRNRHLEPIRYYVFASSVFFLMFFIYLGNLEDMSTDDPAKDYDRRLDLLEQEKKFLNDSPDTVYVNPLITSLKQLSGDTNATVIDSHSNDIEIDFFGLEDTPTDSMNWLERVLAKRIQKKREEMDLDAYADELLHTLPQLIFLSLPFFALFLKVLYWRSRKGRYVEHFIFSIYNYAYLFTVFIVYILINVLLLDNLEMTPAESLIGWVSSAMVFYPFIYLFLSMKRFYNDRTGRLILRYMFLMTLMMITIIALFILVAVIAFMV